MPLSLEPSESPAAARRRLINDVVAAWESWDECPGDPHRAVRMTNACTALTGEASNRFRHHIAASRRAGYSRAAAIYRWPHLPELT